MASGSSLNQKRILVTDINSDFGSEIANALVSEGALVFILVKECRAMQQVLDTYPFLTPILLDICKEKGEEQARKLILSLPTVDHFVNLSGDTGLNVISQAYSNAKIHDVSDTKVKPVIAKMNEAGGRSLVFHVTFGNQNIMSKLKANLDPRFTNSKTAQLSTNLRLSLKKMFPGKGNGETSKQPDPKIKDTNSSNPAPTPAGRQASTDSNKSEDSVIKETQAASTFAAMAATLNQNQGTTENGHSSSGSTANGTSTTVTTTTTTTTRTPTSTTTARIQSQQERNSKIRQSTLKLQKTCAKKWKKAEKRIGKEQKSSLKSLHRDIEKTKRIEKANLIKQVSDANAATTERAKALSSDTATRIIEARENRAEKEAEKHAQKKLEKETTVILESKETQLTEYHEKLYKKMIDREITEFNRIKSKYLV